MQSTPVLNSLQPSPVRFRTVERWAVALSIIMAYCCLFLLLTHYHLSFTVTTYTHPVTSLKTLILLRHGKSSYPPGVPDHERPLAERGWREAALAGAWLRALPVAVAQVLCSTALRTRETLEATQLEAPVIFERGLYGASAVEVVGFVTEIPESVSSVVVIGHHPGMTETAEALHELTGQPPSPALERLQGKYPTSALTRIEIDGSWSELPLVGGQVIDFHVPRQ